MESLWKPTDLLIFTTNAVLKKDGSLVIGRGIARVVRDSFEAHPKAPEVGVVGARKIDRIYGYLVKEYGNLPFIVLYRSCRRKSAEFSTVCYELSDKRGLAEAVLSLPYTEKPCICIGGT